MTEIVNLLDRDLYTMSQADRLLGLSAGTSRRWINGYARNGKQHDPLVRESPTDSEMVTWGEFVEARLISEYRRQGVTVFRMRPAIMALKQEYRANYPLAMAQPFLSAENRELVMEIQRKTTLDPALRFVIRSGQVPLTTLWGTPGLWLSSSGGHTAGRDQGEHQADLSFRVNRRGHDIDAPLGRRGLGGGRGQGGERRGGRGGRGWHWVKHVRRFPNTLNQSEIVKAGVICKKVSRASMSAVNRAETTLSSFHIISDFSRIGCRDVT